MEIPFIGGAYQGRSTNVNAQICQNLYPIIDQEGGKVVALMNTPGLTFFSEPAFGFIKSGSLSLSGSISGVKT
jgi:hypothetical protein